MKTKIDVIQMKHKHNKIQIFFFLYLTVVDVFLCFFIVFTCAVGTTTDFCCCGFLSKISKHSFRNVSFVMVDITFI